jgi:hypothetical protein
MNQNTPINVIKLIFPTVCHVDAIRKCFPVTPATTQAPSETTTAAPKNLTELVNSLSSIQFEIRAQLVFFDGNVTVAAQTNETIIALIDDLLADSTTTSEDREILKEIAAFLKSNSTATPTGARRRRQVASITSTACSNISAALYDDLNLKTTPIYKDFLNYTIDSLMLLVNHFDSIILQGPLIKIGKISKVKSQMTKYVSEISNISVALDSVTILKNQERAVLESIKDTICVPSFVCGECVE